MVQMEANNHFHTSFVWAKLVKRGRGPRVPRNQETGMELKDKTTYQVYPSKLIFRSRSSFRASQGHVREELFCFCVSSADFTCVSLSWWLIKCYCICGGTANKIQKPLKAPLFGLHGWCNMWSVGLEVLGSFVCLVCLCVFLVCTREIQIKAVEKVMSP